MKRKIDPIEQEINEIRLKIYEETKDMTASEFNEYTRKKADAMIKEYNLRTAVSK
jgi:hypothetical protein